MNDESSESKNYIFAFDLSMSRPGITIFSNDGSPILITSIDTKAGKDHAAKLKIIADKVLELKEEYKPLKIVMEGGFSRFNASTHAIYKTHGLINYLFSEVEQITYQPMTVKKVVGGRGNMKKDELKDAILKQYPDVNFDNDDQSDSFAVGLCYFKSNKGDKEN